MKIGEIASHNGCVGSWKEGRAGHLGAGRQLSRVWRQAWVWGLTEHHSEPGALVETERKGRLGADKETSHNGPQCQAKGYALDFVREAVQV